MYDAASRTRLRDKIGYERWLLRFISETQDVFEGGIDTTITLTSGSQVAHVNIGVTEVIGSGLAIKALDALSALTFVSCYKVLDMIFEWILEENQFSVPWEFSKKVKLVKNRPLTYPLLLDQQPYIRKYLLALYENLLDYRNEVVHRNRFHVADDWLIISTARKADSLELDRGRLGALVKVAVSVVDMLAGAAAYDQEADAWLKYHLDRIHDLHGLPAFGQTQPLRVNVELKIEGENGVFRADLRAMRDVLTRIYPNATVVADLKILGLLGGEPVASWVFPAGSVPDSEVLELQSSSYVEHQYPLCVSNGQAVADMDT